MIDDTMIKASSSFEDASVGPHNARSVEKLNILIIVIFRV